MRKLRGTDNEDTLRRGLELAGELAVVQGSPGSALTAAEAVVDASGADKTAFRRLAELLELVQTDAEIAGHLSVDFGLVRSLAYYNGIVFDVTHPQWPGSLGGGGRYDGLAKALGSEELVPALGFAYNLEALLAIIGQDLTAGPEGGQAPSLARPATLVVSADFDSHGEALVAAKELRNQGVSTELDVGGLTLEQALAYASKKGITQVVLVSQDGRRTAHALE